MLWGEGGGGHVGEIVLGLVWGGGGGIGFCRVPREVGRYTTLIPSSVFAYLCCLEIYHPVTAAATLESHINGNGEAPIAVVYVEEVLTEIVNGVPEQGPIPGSAASYFLVEGYPASDLFRLFWHLLSRISSL